jgi:hypothetical protein
MPYVPRWPHKRALAFASTCALMLAFAPAAMADSSTDDSSTAAATANVVVVSAAPVNVVSVAATTAVDPTAVAPTVTLTVPVDLTAPDPSGVSDPYAK